MKKGNNIVNLQALFLSELKVKIEAQKRTLMSKIVIIKYNAGNIQSVKLAFERLGVSPIITDDPKEILSADKVVFPGVGEAKSAMSYLKERGLDKLIKSITQPFLGICIGQQLMCEHSEEGDTDCLGIFPIPVKKFPQGVKINNEPLKIPHMGWNSIYFKEDFPLFKNLKQGSYVYYVHSFYCEKSNEYSVATTDYATQFSAALYRDNFYAVQFHPEKSGEVGQQILKNFLEM